MSSTANQPATKQDVEDIVIRAINHAIDTKVPAIVNKAIDERVPGIVYNIVGEVVGDALTVVGNAFQKAEKRAIEQGRDIKDIKHRLGRLERQYSNTRDIVDHHSVDIRGLQRAITT